MTRYLHIKSFVGFLFLLLAATSCSNEEEAIVMPSNESLKLQVTTVDNAITRSIDGDNTLNENLFKRLDYYFFAANGETQQLKLLKSETGLTDKTTHTSNIRFSDADLSAIFEDNSDTDGATCYVYVVANLDLDNNTLLSPTTISNQITLGELKKVTFQTEGISMNAKQPSFVMYGGGDLKLNITGDKKTVSGEVIRVTRDAAKVSLTVTNIETQVDVKDDAGNVIASYAPDLEGMYVMFYNGMNKSTIHSLIGQDSHYRPNKPDNGYFTLNNMSPDPDIEGDQHEWRQLVAKGSEPNKNLTHEFPYYTYLTDWREGSGYEDYASYMILVVPWGLLDDDGNVASYLPTYYMIETTPTNRGIYSYYENHYYMININIGMLGSWELPEPVKVEAKYMVVDWGEVDVPATLREGEYLILETDKFTVNNQPSGSIPYISSHKIKSVTVEDVEYLSLKTFQSTHATKNANGTWRTYVGNETFTASAANNILTLNHTISPDQYTRYNVKVKIVNEADLSEEVVFTIYPAIYADLKDGGNVFVNGRFGHVINPPGKNGYGSLSWQPNRTQDGAEANSFRWAIPTHYSALDSYDGIYPSENQFNPRRRNVAGYYGSIYTVSPSAGGGTALDQRKITRITISSFSDADNYYTLRGSNTRHYYMITDPRRDWTSNDGTLTSYIRTRESSYNPNTPELYDGNDAANSPLNANYVSLYNWETYPKLGTDVAEYIAPDVLIVSAWGRHNPYQPYYDQAMYRCATYQEAGYPAGRWRLPTEAELAYFVHLQGEGVIEKLFNTSTQYWASNGRIYRPYNDGSLELRNETYGSSRCVYDIWFWGEDITEPTNVFHPMPTKEYKE